MSPISFEDRRKGDHSRHLMMHVVAGSSKQPHQITLTIIHIYNSCGYSTCTPTSRLNNVVEVLYVWANITVRVKLRHVFLLSKVMAKVQGMNSVDAESAQDW